MSGIAKILAELGYIISGSDKKLSKITEGLEDLGVKVYEDHKVENLAGDVDKVVVSTAIRKDNPELQEALKRNLPIIQRGEMLATLMEMKQGIAIAGAHGKTTTSSMVSLVLEKNFLDPTIVVGGVIADLGGNAKLGQGQYLVAEADESDGSFLKLSPYAAVITNIEDDHLDYYGNCENILKAFRQFAQQIDDKGFAVFCIDDPNVKLLKDENLHKTVYTYGLSAEADYRASDIVVEGLTNKAKIYFKNDYLGEMLIKVPGVHNVKNALAAVAVGHQLGIDFDGIVRALKTFRGVQRRFQILGQVNGITVVDDYAHHPTEVEATLKAAKQSEAPRVVGIFQPHRYSRTQSFYKEFGRAFKLADEIIINDIYSAGEEPIEGVTSELIVEEAIKAGQKKVKHISSGDETVKYLVETLQEGDLVLTLGAGDVWQTGVKLLKELQEKEATKGELRKSGS